MCVKRVRVVHQDLATRLSFFLSFSVFVLDTQSSAELPRVCHNINMDRFLENLRGTSALRTAASAPAIEEGAPAEGADSNGSSSSSLSSSSAAAEEAAVRPTADGEKLTPGDDDDDDDDDGEFVGGGSGDEDEDEDEDDEIIDPSVDVDAGKYTVQEDDPMAGLDASLIIEGGRRRKRRRT